MNKLSFGVFLSRLAQIGLGIVLFSGTSSLLVAQQATISGVVTDSQGASIPDASVVATNRATGVASTTTSNNAGVYALPNLPIGAYSLTVTRDGFKKYVNDHITLSTNQVVGLNANLLPGSVTQSVTVTDDRPELETKTSEIGQTIESKSVSELPLGNRTSMNIVSLAAGAVFIDSSNYSLSGGRTKSSMVWLDGGSGQNIRIGIGTAEVSPPVDTIQELGIISNNYAAEFGGSSGGVIVQTTKSGTNRFHGSLYEFLRNDDFDASGYFAQTKPELRYNIFGGTIGGPIRHDKTFFFFGYEGSRQRSGTTDTLTVPTLLERQGNFSELGVNIYDPKTTTTVNGVTTRTQFANNTITDFDSVGSALISYFPEPTNSKTANNFVKNEVDTNNSGFYIARVDQVLGARDKMAFRYIHTSTVANNDSVYPVKAADPYADANTNDDIGYAQWLHTLSPAIVNDLRFTFETRVNHASSAGIGGGWPTKLGISGVYSQNAFPYFSASGYSALGTTSQERRQYPIDQYQLVDDTSWLIGKHSIKLGLELHRSMDHESNLSTASGSFTFGTLGTGLPGNTSTGNGFASLLVGFPTAFSESETDATTRTSWYIAGFAQDDFTVSPRHLTLNLGLRWETDTPIKDENNRMNGFNSTETNPVSGTQGVVKFMGVNGFRTAPYDLDLNNFGPRFGFAWQPFGAGRTVVRGGFGYFFSHPFDAGQPASAALGFGVSAALNTPDNGVTAPFYLDQGVPAVATEATHDDSYGAVTVGSTATTAVSYFDPRHRTGYAQQWNLGIQQQLPGSFVLEISGEGNIAHKLPGQNQAIDQIAPSVLSASHHSQSNRPYPQFSGVTLVAPSIGNSNYFAGVVQLERKFSRGFNIHAAYTFSKLLDDNEGSGSTLGNTAVYSNYYNRSADYGPGGNDVRHNFVFSAVYELPFGPGRALLNHGVLSHAVGAWTLGNVTRLYSGPPFSVITNTNSTAAFSSGSQRANLIADPALSKSKRSAAEWFNTSAFAEPANYTFGNSGRNLLRAPGYADLDFSLIRNVNFTDGKVLEIRGEAFNILNHTNFGLPSSTYGASGFGTITSSLAARQIQVGARFVF